MRTPQQVEFIVISCYSRAHRNRKRGVQKKGGDLSTAACLARDAESRTIDSRLSTVDSAAYSPKSPVRGASASSGSTKYSISLSRSSSSSVGCGGAGGGGGSSAGIRTCR